MNSESNHNYYNHATVAAGLLEDEVSLGEIRLTDELRNHPGVLLDIGCGSGRLHNHLQRSHIVGIDYAWAQLASYRHHSPAARLVHGTATSLPFTANSFDVVLLSYHLIESIIPAAARESAFMEASRVLRPAGFLYLTRHRRARYKLRQQLVDRITGAVSNFGDLQGKGASRAGGNDLSGFTMHVLCSREMSRLAHKAGLTQVDAWDFDDGGRQRWISRAIVEKYRK